MMSNNRKKEEENICRECGRAFYGRRDKNFCSLECKNRWHNRVVRERRRVRTETLAQISRNYNILSELLAEDKNSASLQELAKAGFDPAFATGHRKGSCRHDDYSCFDISYYRSSTKVFNVRRRNAGGR